MTDEGPKLNGPDRYRKRSPRLVLEEHSHCEVPAGCGGVVLRWINADRELPVQVRLYSHLDGASLTLDGAAPASSRPLLARGDHVLAIHVRVERGCGALLCSLRFDEDDYDRKVSRKTGVTFRCDTADDGAWLASTAPPADPRWRDDPFDDRAWTPMVAMPVPAPARGDGRSWYHDLLLREGAVAIGVPDHEGELWIRRRFRVPLPGEEGGGT